MPVLAGGEGRTGARGKLNLELRTWLKHLNLKRNMSSSGKSQQCQLINWSARYRLGPAKRPNTHIHAIFKASLPAGLKQKGKACLIIRAKTTRHGRRFPFPHFTFSISHLPLAACQRQQAPFGPRQRLGPGQEVTSTWRAYKKGLSKYWSE